MSPFNNKHRGDSGAHERINKAGIINKLGITKAICLKKSHFKIFKLDIRRVEIKTGRKKWTVLKNASQTSVHFFRPVLIATRLIF